MSGHIVINGVICDNDGKYYIPREDIYCFICKAKQWAYKGQRIFFITQYHEDIYANILYNFGGGDYLGNCHNAKCIEAAAVERVCPKF